MSKTKMIPLSDVAVVWSCPVHGDQFIREGIGIVTNAELSAVGPEKCPLCKKPMDWRSIVEGVVRHGKDWEASH